MSMDFTGKTAIITGASGQLGSRIAVSLASRGLDCVCQYHRNVDSVQETVAAIETSGRRAVAVKADLSDASAATELFSRAADWGDVRVLVNSASVFQRQPLGTFTAADVSQMMAVHVTTPLMLCSAFAGHLKQTGVDDRTSDQAVASIINMVDVAAIKPWGQYSPYCAGRAAMVAVTKSLAKELAPAVTVNAIAPGIVTWPGKMDPTEEQKQRKRIPVGRFGRPEEVTRTIDFLLGNPYITGQVICVDGGRSL